MSILDRWNAILGFLNQYKYTNNNIEANLLWIYALSKFGKLFDLSGFCIRIFQYGIAMSINQFSDFLTSSFYRDEKKTATTGFFFNI